MESIDAQLEFKNYYALPLAGNPSPIHGALIPKCIFYNSCEVEEEAIPEFQ